MTEVLKAFDEGLSSNEGVQIVGKKPRFKVRRLKAMPMPPNLRRVGLGVSKRWPTAGLLDMLKESDLRTALRKRNCASGCVCTGWGPT